MHSETPLELAEALLEHNLAQLVECLRLLARERMKADPDTTHLAEYLDARADVQVDPVWVHDPNNVLRSRTDIAVHALLEKELTSQLRFVRRVARQRLDAQVREDLGELEF
jgi:hypothetical protein